MASPFTEAHFAATLLHCGPHVGYWQEIHTPGSDAYINRVYSYFFELFPRKVDFFGAEYSGTHEWHVFWNEYSAWVGGKS